MPRFLIRSEDDPRVGPYRDLPGRGPSGHDDLFIAEGRLLVERLLASDYRTESILVDERRIEAIGSSLPPETLVYVAPHELMRRILGFKFHQGVMACGRRKSPIPLGQALSPDCRRFLVVVCVDIQDPENMGSILRNCAAFGVDAVVVTEHCTSPFSRRVLRVSMGTVLKLPIVPTSDLDQELSCLRYEWRAQLAAAVLDDSAEPLEAVNRPDRLVILFGNEADGLDRRWIDGCDRKITIPMRGGTDSLNVAVASGVFLYHFTRVGARSRSRRRE